MLIGSINSLYNKKGYKNEEKTQVKPLQRLVVFNTVRTERAREVMKEKHRDRDRKRKKESMIQREGYRVFSLVFIIVGHFLDSFFCEVNV